MFNTQNAVKKIIGDKWKKNDTKYPYITECRICGDKIEIVGPESSEVCSKCWRQ